MYVWFLALALLPAQGSEGSPDALSWEVGEPAESPLLGYAWDEGDRIPVLRGAQPERISVGEAGANRWTRSYFNFNEGRGARCRDLVDGHRRLGSQGLEWSPGRFGTGVEFSGAESRLGFGPGSAALFSTPSTVSFWLRPLELVDRRNVFEVPGLYRLTLEKDGWLRLVTADGGLNMAATVQVGRWHHVGIVVDGPDYAEVRLILDGEFQARRTSTCLQPDGAQEFVWGNHGGQASARFQLDDLRIDARARTSKELLDVGMGTVSPGPHRLRLDYGERLEELEVWGQVHALPQLSGAALAAGQLRHAKAGDEGLRRVAGHWEFHPADVRPRARTTHPTVHVGGQRIFIYGGEVRDTHGVAWAVTDDTWLYDTAEKSWEQVVGGPAPAPRCHQDAAYSPDHDLVLFPAGWRNDLDPSIQYRDLWCFFPESGRWERRLPKGARLPRTSNSCVVYHPPTRRFLLFLGGRRRVYVYDPLTNELEVNSPFEIVDQDGGESEFSVRGSMMSGFDPNTGLVVLFGGEMGYPDTIFYDQTILYDPARNRCTVLDAPGPSPRVRSAFAYDEKRGHFVLFGGVQDQGSTRNGDLWVFDPRTRAWSSVESSATPTQRGGFYGMAYEPVQDRFFVLCGRHSLAAFLDEAWSLALDPGAEAQATYAFDRAGFGSAQTLYVDTRGGAPASVDWAASSDGGRWGPWRNAADAPVEGRFVQLRITLGGGASVPELVRLGFGASSLPDLDDGQERARFDVAPLEE